MGSAGSYGPIILTALSLRSILSITPYLTNRCCSMVSADTCPKPVSWSTSGDSKTGSTTATIWFFQDPSTAVYFRNSAWFLSELFSYKRLFLGAPHALWVVACILRWHKIESYLFHVLLVHHRQRKVSISASSKVWHHRRCIPTDQSMYVDQSFYCWLYVNIWKDGCWELREDSLDAASCPRHFVLQLCWDWRWVWPLGQLV